MTRTSDRKRGRSIGSYLLLAAVVLSAACEHKFRADPTNLDQQLLNVSQFDKAGPAQEGRTQGRESRYGLVNRSELNLVPSQGQGG